MNKIFTSYMTEIVMPGDTNYHKTLFGGKLMQWIDTCAAIAAQRCAGLVVTASIDNLIFKNPVNLGDIVTLEAAVNHIWNTSMEVGVTVSSQSINIDKISEPKKVCKAYLTFVAVDENGKRRKILFDEDQLVTGDWARRWIEAEERRKLRLSNGQ